MLEPDNMRGIPLDMDQYTRLFGTARIPTEVRYLHLRARHCARLLMPVLDCIARLQDGGAFGIATHRRPQAWPVLYGFLSLFRYDDTQELTYA